MSDQTPETAAVPEPAAAGEECADCIGGRALVLAVAFAAFAAFVAADFYLNGRLTAAVVGTLGTLRGRGGRQ